MNLKKQSDIAPPSLPVPTRQNRHVHPDERAKIAATNAVSKTFGRIPEESPDVSYYSPELIQCTLPHSDPKSPAWVRRNGNFSLIVASGFDKTGSPIGIPYGSFPRLVLAHIITQVIETHDRRIELSSHFGRFLRDIGYTGNHKGSGTNGKRIRDQLIRLLRATVTYEWDGSSGGYMGYAAQDVKVAPKFALWFDFRNPEQDSLFGSWIELSEEFYQSILRAPVPLRTDILKDLKKSPLALDIYMWVSYRLFSMQVSGQSELSLSYGSLQEQFGTGVAEANYRQFRSVFKANFIKVADHWQPHNTRAEKSLLNYELNETGLVLYRSPLLIGRGDRLTKQEEIEQILQRRTFDQETRRKARQLAGHWDIDFLITQYFDWITREGITPKNPPTHFYAFIRSHRKKNG